MRKFLLLGLAALALAACGTQPARAGTGLRGTVTIAPTCPVERVGAPPCVAPLAATISVRNASGQEITRFRSGADGTFKVDLAAGTYTLVGISSGPAGLPRPIPVTVTVLDGQYSQVNVTFDSGIR
jgi:hypothetical protein